MKKRHKISRKRSRRTFSHHAVKVHRKNGLHPVMRGGIRF